MINFKFIQELEGDELVGYVPPLSCKSGVTIASGFDIGQRSVNELEDAFNDDLVDKLKLYVELTGLQAELELERNPLLITNAEASLINEYAHKQASDRLHDEWCGNVPFDCLSDECQTVVASVAFQYGSLVLKCPNFWRQITSGDWYLAHENLRDFQDDYSVRRNKEADLLGSWINKKLKE